MRFSFLLLSILSASTAVAINGGVAERLIHTRERRQSAKRDFFSRPQKRSPTEHKFLTNQTKPYAVDGDNFPGVPFPIGESYAGTLPIFNESAPQELFFWFFPSNDGIKHKEILIWLQGGPGCSSMLGLLQENGPFLWQPGVYEPFINPYSWTNLTNVVWIDQPAGTGLSPGPFFVADEADAAQQFLSFWKRFIELFDMQGFDIYITGESYAGKWVPWTASAMLDRNDTTHYNVKGISVMDGNWGDSIASQYIGRLAWTEKYQAVLNINETYMANLTHVYNDCGFQAFEDEYFVFPPAGVQPLLHPDDYSGNECDTYMNTYPAATWANPCFNAYHITDICPFLSDPLDFLGYSTSPPSFFNRSDVQAALHVQPTDYEVCSIGEYLLYNDTLDVPARTVLPGIIERTNNVVLGNGDLDYLFLNTGGLVAIQNMTWNEQRGFQSKPEKMFYVPFAPGVAENLETGAIPSFPWTETSPGGDSGVWHTERGLTWVQLYLAGHETAEYVPAASLLYIQYLLGRIDDLGPSGTA